MCLREMMVGDVFNEDRCTREKVQFLGLIEILSSEEMDYFRFSNIERLSRYVTGLWNQNPSARLLKMEHLIVFRVLKI